MISINSIEMIKADMRYGGHIQTVLWVAVVSQLSRNILCSTEYSVNIIVQLENLVLTVALAAKKGRL